MAADNQQLKEPLKYSGIYNPDEDFDRHYTIFTAKRIAKRLGAGSSILELGCATSLMTSHLSSEQLTFECVEKAQEYIDIAKARNLPNVTYHQGTLEAFAPSRQFNHILMTNLIHEIEEPAPLLKRVGEWLLPGGELHVTSPNPDSIHRKVAVIAGLLKDTAELSERGKKFLTLRLYRNAEVVSLVERASGLKLVHNDGILFKPLTNAQMAALDQKILEAFDTLAHDFPDNGAMTYFVFKKEK